MAVATTHNAAWSSRLNPFRIHGTALPPNLLLMVKLVVVGLFIKGYHLSFPDAFAPFIGLFDLVPEPWFRRAFKVLFSLSALGLMCNRAVRTNCIIIGCLFLVATLSSTVYYRNAKVFVGLLFLLTGLQGGRAPPLLIWWQLGIMYLGAGINKLFEADWRSGQYFDHFLGDIYGSSIYLNIAPLLPGNGLAMAMCWWVILAELSAGILFFLRRYHAAAVWLAASVHCGAAILVAGDYGIYLAAVLASFLALLRWPERDEERHAPPGTSKLHRLVWKPLPYFIALVCLTAPFGAWRAPMVRLWGSVGAVILAVVLVKSLLGLRRQGERSERL